MSPRARVIAIDGPSGVGKGTVARTLARVLGYRHVDTGSMYRAVAWQAAHDGLDLHNEASVEQIARAASIVIGDTVAINGTDVTGAIRTPDIDRAASVVARHARVRAVLVERQRAYADEHPVVMEGRDIGTVVFPDAEVKLYLDASTEERARRRAADPAHAAGQTGEGQRIAEALAERDRSDSTRAASPLTRADDAVYIDTTGVPLEDVVARALDAVRARKD